MTDRLLAYRAHACTRGYQRREAAAIALLTRHAPDRLAIATSWGKDSAVLVHLARRVWPHPVLLHLASPARLPGGERVAHTLAAGCEVVTLPAATPDLAGYLQWLRTVGLPHERTRAQEQRTVRRKRDPLTAWVHDHHYDGIVLGMRAEENPRTRGRLFRARGPVYRTAAGLAVNPLAWWTARDIWAYIARYDLPYHPLYDCETHGYTRETLRNAGWCTTIGASRGRVGWLRTHYPSEYRALAAAFPEVATYA